MTSLDAYPPRCAALCELLGIALPVIGAPMGGVSGPELAAAVSEAGGLGLLGVSVVDLAGTREQIRAAKALTDQPIGVGLLFPTNPEAAGGVPPPPPPLPEFLRRFGDARDEPPAAERRYATDLAEQRLDIAIAEGVSVLACGLGAPPHVIARARAAGMRVIVLVGSRRAAIEVAAAGADVVVAQGHEAGGHTGHVPTMVLVPQVVDALRVPVVAAGGIADGRGLAASIMLGASGALIGTRLLATPEARTSDGHKARVVAMRDDETVVSRCYTGKPSRVLRNAFTDAWRGRDADILPMPRQWEMVAPLVAHAKREGSLDLGNWPTGQAAVLVEAVMPAAELVRRIAADAARLLGAA